MSEKEYMDADYEVISMVNRKAGPGGELPTKVVHFVPGERASVVLAIDERIQKIRQHMPLIVTAALILSFIIGFSV